MGKVWKFRKKLGKNWKFGDQFETQKTNWKFGEKIGNLKKNWKFGNHNRFNLSKLLP